MKALPGAGHPPKIHRERIIIDSNLFTSKGEKLVPPQIFEHDSLNSISIDCLLELELNGPWYERALGT